METDTGIMANGVLGTWEQSYTKVSCIKHIIYISFNPRNDTIRSGLFSLYRLKTEVPRSVSQLVK